MLIQMCSLAFVGGAAYYLCKRTLETSPMLAPYPLLVWGVVLLFVSVAFVAPAVISHLPRNYVIQLNPNYWAFTKLMLSFIFALALMIFSDLYFYLADSQISPVTLSRLLNYRPLFIFRTALLSAVLFF